MTFLQQAGAIRNGHHPPGGARFVFLLFCFALQLFPLPGSAIELAEISRLSRGGASQLALSLISEAQPAYEDSPANWQRWERVRIRIMEEHASWSELAEHIAQYSHALPDDFLHWSEERQANALIEAGRYTEARQLLRSLIWGDSETPEYGPQRLSRLRQLVMQSYLEEGRIKDAFAALLRFQQDYSAHDSEAVLLRAKVLLAAGRAGESLALLHKIKPEGTVMPLTMLAELRNGGDASLVLKQIRGAGLDSDDVRVQRLWLGVMAEAANALDDNASLVIALERMLALDDTLQIPDSERRLFSFSADQLWQAYLDYAIDVGNREQLLLGDDGAWFSLAEGTDARYPVRKRSLYALLALRASDAGVRLKAHAALLEMLDDIEERGVVLMKRLYLDSERFGEAGGIPQPIAYRLVDEAIKNGELVQASMLLQQLPEPPGETERFAWQMRRAKVFLLAGDYAQADSLLMALMPSAAALTDQQRDQVVQLLFDFQAVNEHERAFRLLQTLYSRIPAIKLRRELLFWMADSRKAQGRHSEAARYYLQSATLADNNSMDPWAQTARYQAAKSLTEAGLTADAAFIYRQLLAITESAERRSVLRHELQQLRLRAERR